MMNDKLQKYDDIMNIYRSGKLGDTNLSMNDILKNVEQEDLFNQMDIEDIDFLINNSIGITKYMFLLIKNKKMLDINNNGLDEHKNNVNQKVKVKRVNKPKK